MNETKRVILICLFIIAIFASFPLAAQEKPGLGEKDLEKHVYYFDVENGKLTGDGARFLIDEITRSQFVLIGEYHNSLRISEFTKAVIPVFQDAGCRTFALEVGPVSADILAELAKHPEKTAENLKSFNSRFYFVERGGTYTPIPFFSNVEDAEFLAEAARRRWNLIELDQEFSFGYVPLAERMYKNLSRKKQAELKQLFDKTVSLLKTFYETEANGGQPAPVAIYESKEINQFLDAAAEDNPQNRRVADALRKTTEIYRLYSLRRYYEANSRRVEYMKRNLAESMARHKFDWRRDRLLLKMGGYHTGRGFSTLSLFEIGSTLSELAEFHGNRSLHINFGSRFYRQPNGTETDALEDKNGYLYRFLGLTQIARKDKWTMIDLRPLRQDVFYRRKFKLDDMALEIFKNHNFFIVPKTETAPTPNYSVAK